MMTGYPTTPPLHQLQSYVRNDSTSILRRDVSSAARTTTRHSTTPHTAVVATCLSFDRFLRYFIGNCLPLSFVVLLVVVVDLSICITVFIQRCVSCLIAKIAFIVFLSLFIIGFHCVFLVLFLVLLEKTLPASYLIICFFFGAFSTHF